jgi:hypothetical protein
MRRWQNARAMKTRPFSARELVTLAVIVAIGVAFVVPRLALPLSFDATHSYLPMARRLLAEGVGYLHRPESLAYAPLAYAYPALLGANEIVIRWANVAAYGVTIVLAFLAVRSAHGARAGLAAALLLAVSPTLRPYIADILTEPPFLLFTSIWVASIAAVLRGHRVAGAVAGGIALALAALTRPAVMLFPLLLAIGFGWRARRGTGEERRTDAALAAMHAGALAACGLFIARNAIEFGFPSIAAGFGAALFFGINPLVDGFDPYYYGLVFDDGAVTQGLFGHLSLEGDRLLRRVAMRELADIPWPVLFEMGVRKALAFLFVTDSEAVGNVALLRTWRVALVSFALAAVFLERRSRVVIALAAWVVYMAAVHLPLLYHHRYSVGAVDFPLTLLAAIGIVASLRSPARFAALSFIAVLAAGLGLVSMADAGPGSPHAARSPHDLIWFRGEPATVHVASAGAIEIPVTHATGFNPYNHYMLAMELAVKPDRRGARCAAMRLRYKGLAEERYAAARVVRVPLRSDGRMRELAIGMTSPVSMNHEGVLRLEFECESGATVNLGKISVLNPNRAVVYRKRVLN